MPKTPKLNTHNPEQLHYKTEELGFTILGGIRIEGLDRLRVTIKIEIINRKHSHYLNHPDLANLAIRHNLDLYNDTQVEKLIRRSAEKLEVGTIILSQSIADITSQLEAYRLSEIEKENTTQQIHYKLKKEEKKQAKQYLENPNLFAQTGIDIGKSGVVGEEKARLTMYIIFTSRKRSQPLHVVSLGRSGVGKSHLQEKVGELIPEEDKLEITTLSENAFYYFERKALSHKLILIEDLDGAESSLYPLRELQSKKRISKRVAHKDSRGNTRTVPLTVEGPVSVAGCTTKENLYEDNANRSFLIYIDESLEQDEEIMNYQRKSSAGKINHEEENRIKELFKNCQRILQPISVRNPYAEQLKIPKEVFKPRRTNSHYLAFIEAVTFYHQYQREEKTDEETGEIYIETTLEDIQNANTLLKEILIRKSDELSGACRNYFERLKRWLKEEKKTAFTNLQARIALRENHSNQKRYMIQLQQENLIRKGQGDKKKGYYYEVLSMEEYEKLRSGIAEVLDHIFLNLEEEVQSSVAVQTQNEPLSPMLKFEIGKKFKSSRKGVRAKIKT